MDISYINPKAVIICPTLEIFIAVKSLNPNNQVKDYRWEKNKELTCYNPNAWQGHGSTISSENATDKIILDYRDFIGDGYEVPFKFNRFNFGDKILHKNTDLGHFSSLFIASGYTVDDAILKAKDLIKKLNEEDSLRK